MYTNLDDIAFFILILDVPFDVIFLANKLYMKWACIIFFAYTQRIRLLHLVGILMDIESISDEKCIFDAERISPFTLLVKCACWINALGRCIESLLNVLVTTCDV